MTMDGLQKSQIQVKLALVFVPEGGYLQPHRVMDMDCIH